MKTDKFPRIYTNIADVVQTAHNDNRLISAEDARILHFLSKDFYKDLKTILAVKSSSKKFDYDIVMNPTIILNFNLLEFKGLQIYSIRLKNGKYKLTENIQKYSANHKPTDSVIYMVIEKSSLEEKPLLL